MSGILATGLTACASLRPDVYVVDSQNPSPTMSISEAVQTITQFRGQIWRETGSEAVQTITQIRRNMRRETDAPADVGSVVGVAIRGNSVEFSTDSGGTPIVVSLPVAKVTVSAVGYGDSDDHAWAIISTGIDAVGIQVFGGSDGHRPTRTMERFADAITQLPVLLAQERKAREDAFAAVARSYRTAQVKPVPGEDVRRLGVQAIDAVKHSRFADAENLYEQGLTIAPWWPAGHHDRAFVLAELGRNREAVVEMQRYLELVPDAPDARAMRDQIYVWQGREAAGQPSSYPGNAPTATVAQPSSPPSGGGSLGGTLFQGVVGGGPK